MKKTFNIIFGMAIVGILGTWLFYAFVAFKVVESDNFVKDLGKEIGGIVKNFEEGMEEGQASYEEALQDTTPDSTQRIVHVAE